MAVEMKVKNTVFPEPFSEARLEYIKQRAKENMLKLVLNADEEEKLKTLKNKKDTEIELTELEKNELKNLEKRKKDYEYYQANADNLKNQALLFGGYAAGVCYMEGTYEDLLEEEPLTTLKRIDRILDSCHHSVYDHLQMTFDLTNIPKILAMFLNNEHQYTTSEKSARYTKMDNLSPREKELYDKWYDILVKVISDEYKTLYDEKQIVRYSPASIGKLAQENARYMTSVFTQTSMEYSDEWRQLNYIYSWLDDWGNQIKKWGTDKDIKFSSKIIPFLKGFKTCLEEENERLKKETKGQKIILEPRLHNNDKNRTFSLFVDLEEHRHTEEQFGYNYSFLYKGSFAQLAQAHRHRNIFYTMALLEEPEFFIPPIIADDEALTKEWLKDITSVADLYPQGMLVSIHESADIYRFIQKCKERICTFAQLEINDQTNVNMQRYYQELLKNNPYWAKKLEPYTKGARCTFPDYKCLNHCQVPGGPQLTRKI